MRTRTYGDIQKIEPGVFVDFDLSIYGGETLKVFRRIHYELASKKRKTRAKREEKREITPDGKSVISVGKK